MVKASFLCQKHSILRGVLEGRELCSEIRGKIMIVGMLSGVVLSHEPVNFWERLKHSPGPLFSSFPGKFAGSSMGQPIVRFQAYPDGVSRNPKGPWA
jgi:hypothetical protein